MVDKKHKISALVFGKLSCFEEIRVGDYLFTDKNKFYAYRVIRKEPKSSEVTVRASMFRDDGFERNAIYTREDVKPASEGCRSEKVQTQTIDWLVFSGIYHTGASLV